MGPGAPDDCRWRDEAGAVSQEFGKSAERRASANQRRLATGSLANRQDGVSSGQEASRVEGNSVWRAEPRDVTVGLFYRSGRESPRDHVLRPTACLRINVVSLNCNFHNWNFKPDGGCNRQVAHPRNHPNALSRTLCIRCAETGLPSLPIKGVVETLKPKVAKVAI